MEKINSLVVIILTAISFALTGQMKFTEVSKTAGINHQYIVYEGFFGGGVAVLDINNDGFQDVYLTSGLGQDQLLLNHKDGSFTNIYKGSGLEESYKYVTLGVSSADVNKDGFVDIFITTSTTKDMKSKIPRAKNLLFLNNGDNTFKDATAQFGLDKFSSFSTGVSFGDFNNDGYPDIYVGNYFQDYEGTLNEISDATIVNANNTAKDYLLLNQHGRSFKNVYDQYGLDHKGFGFGANFTDFDNDGDLDLIVINDFGYKAKPNYFLRNDFPEKKFTYIEKENGMDLRINAMTAATGDYDNDGNYDYFLTNIKFNRFMVNRNGKFVDKAQELGTSFFTISWGANFGDFDHDGDLDLFVLNGDLNPYTQPMGSYLFENDSLKFKDIAFASNINDYGVGRGSVLFDYDNDGDLDVLVVNQKPVKDGYPVESMTHLYRNDSVSGNWLQIKLMGKRSDANGLGATVVVYTKESRMMREVDGGGSSHLSQNSSVQHFGMGSNTTADSVIVKWIGGSVQKLENVAANQLLVITQNEEAIMGRGMHWGYYLLITFLVLSVYFVSQKYKRKNEG
jgi:hypothetical protein